MEKCFSKKEDEIPDVQAKSSRMQRKKSK